MILKMVFSLDVNLHKIIIQLHIRIKIALFSKSMLSVLKKINFTIFFAGFGPAVRVFANGAGDLGSIPGRVIPKTLKMELDTTLLNTEKN